LTPSSFLRKLLPLLAAIGLLVAVVLASTASGAPSTLKYSELPDPLAYGKYTPKETNPVVFGETALQEPNSKGGAATGANSAITVPVRGSMWTPENYPGKSPLLLFVHGNHGECDKGSGPKCEIYKRNDEGYAYMAKNLASWGYTVVSLDQDELMARQDSLGKGMHARRLLIMAMLDKIKQADEEPLTTEGANVGSSLVGKIDMTRIGLMGHSRGGDAVASFVLYNQTLPVGERFPLRGVVSIAPVDYERHAPYGVPYLTVFGSCDGDVSNLQGARLYERSQYESNDPYPRFQVVQVGGNHDAYNTVWQADGDDSSQADAACGPDAKGSKGQVPTESKTEPGVFSPENVLGTLNTEDPHNIRLSGEAGPHFEAVTGETKPYRWGNAEKLNPLVNTRMSGDPALMGDQEKMGLATVAAFFRRYVGGEGAFEPYLTGELAAEGEPSIPQSACPSSEAGKRIPCIDRVADSYTAPPNERMDVLRPDTEHPTTLDALGTKIEAAGFANPYPKGGGVQPRPATTPNGIDWCDPDPHQAEPAQLKEGEFPTASKSCPQPAAHTLGGQGRNETPGAESTAEPRENAPVNGSYGRQLALAWEEPADLGLNIPAADGNVSGYKALYMATAVNFFDPRNPLRGEEGLWNPEAAPQNWTIAVKDAEGNEGTVEAANPDFGTATQQTLGSTSDRVHVILRDLRVPLAEFAEQGVNLSKLRKLELRFGGEGMPSSGSIQLADVNFEQPATGFSSVLLDSTTPNAGPGEGEPKSGPNPVTEIHNGTYKRANGEYEIPNVTKIPGANVWTVDDDGVQCPNAQFEHIQEAVEYASPWDTIVVCPGIYAESSTPVNSELNPVLVEGEKDGLTINKPLKIIGAGASKVTIKPAGTTSLGGATGSLRDGGGNVITVSRQSLGSTEYDEEYVDISGVKIETGSATAEAGVAFFNASGRIANSEITSVKPVNGNGWGVVETNSQIGSGPGAAERQVTIENSTIKGYSSGGVLFDDSKGKADGTATNTERSEMNQTGYVFNSTIEGSGGTATVPQTGIAFRSGAHGKVTGSSIVKNRSTTGATSSYGILAADSGSVLINNDNLAGNGGKGYALYNGNAAATEPSTGTPINATGDFWGTSGTPVEGESVITTSPASDAEGIGGPVTFSPVATAAPVVPKVLALLPDSAPVGKIVNPGDGETVEAGVTSEPVVFAEDDYGVASVSLKANGKAVGARSIAPYVFTWTPTIAEIGTSVHLEATITDSGGHMTTSTITVPVIKSATETAAEEKAKAEQKAAEEAQKAAEKAKKEAEEKEVKAAEEKAAAQKELKEAVEKAEAAGKSAEKAAAEATAKAEEAVKAAKEATVKAAQEVKAAEEKAEKAAKEAAEAKKALEAAEKKSKEEAEKKAHEEAEHKHQEEKEAKEQKEHKEKEEREEKEQKEQEEKEHHEGHHPELGFGKLYKNTKNGTARLGVTVPSSGQLTVSGPEIQTESGHVSGPTEVLVSIEARGNAARTLDYRGKVTVKVTASFGGKSVSTMVTLEESRHRPR
jgi:large repetitive protein